MFTSKFISSLAFAGYLSIFGFYFQPAAIAQDADSATDQTRCTQYLQALTILNQDIQAGYADASIYELRGDVYKAMGQLDLALIDYKHSVELRSSEITIGCTKACAR